MPKDSQAINLPDSWRHFLTEVDKALDEQITLVCLGGFVLAALYGLTLPTGDVDYVEISPPTAQDKLFRIAGKGSPLAKRHNLYFDRVTVAELAENYEERLAKLEIGLQNLNIQVLDPCDIVLTKLCSHRPKDSADAKRLIQVQKLEFDRLYSIWELEMKPWIGRAEYHDNTIQLFREHFMA